MALLVALFFSYLIVENVNNQNIINTEKEKIEIISNKTAKNKETTLEVKSETNKPELIKKEAKPEPVKEEIKPEPVKEEIKPEPVKEEIKPEPVKEEIKPELVNEEAKTDSIKEKVKEVVEPTTSWLKLALYILGPLLIIVIGKFFYSRLRNKFSSSGTNDYMRREFKEETQSDSTEQQPAQEETQSDSTEQQPAQEETQSDSTEQPVEEDENNKK